MHDYVIVGSGFGGSVSALRLVEKGYDVLMLEKGRRFQKDDFAKSNWDLRRWMWNPALGFRGPFKMTFLRHMTVLSGVGVGGGSLVYANTLPTPKEEFFSAPSWGALASWKDELAPHYDTALRMLGATENPYEAPADKVIHDLARDLGREDQFHRTRVAVYFGKAGEKAPDPYFGGEGPEVTGCQQCGGCMLGCRHGAKNTLDRNYLWLAEKRGLRIQPETEAKSVRQIDGGYELETTGGTFQAKNVIFAGGVLGTIPLLLKLKKTTLPDLSDKVGDFVRTNSEALIGVVSSRKDLELSTGIAIGSMLQTDEHSHVEPCRYPAGSGFFRTLGAPLASGKTVLGRVFSSVVEMFRTPVRYLRSMFTPDWARRTMILLYMRTLEGHLRLKLGRFGGLTTAAGSGPLPTSAIPEAQQLARKVADMVDGFPQSMVTEILLGTPTTAHILGGACMGDSRQSGVIDTQHRVFGYPGLYVIDGSAISANPGVNPSLTICALAERAMSFIPPRQTSCKS